MKLNSKELEELITYAQQCKSLCHNITYNDELIDNIYKSIKNKVQLSDQDLRHCQNNFIALSIIGIVDYNNKLFQRIDKYFD